jgi:hypothetical protein
MVACYMSFITGMMVGIEFADYEDSNYLIINLFIVQIMIEWENK